MDYLVLYSDGGFGVLAIGDDADDHKIFKKLMEVFTTERGYFYDNYESQTISIFTSDDVALVVEENDTTRKFGESLKGHGFELFACWHDHGRQLYEEGVYKENHFLDESGLTVYGPIVLRAQIIQDPATAVEVPASHALYVAELIVKAKGESTDIIFGSSNS